MVDSATLFRQWHNLKRLADRGREGTTRGIAASIFQELQTMNPPDIEARNESLNAIDGYIWEENGRPSRHCESL